MNHTIIGKVHIPLLKPYPQGFRAFLKENTDENVNSLDNMCSYNNAFSFMTFGTNISVSHGIYCFRIQGQTYHDRTKVYP